LILGINPEFIVKMFLVLVGIVLTLYNPTPSINKIISLEAA